MTEAIWNQLLIHDLLLYRCDGCGRLRLVRMLRHEFVPDTHFTAERCGLFCKRCQS